MTSLHRMPFGAEPRPDGVRFSLWAPSASSVSLALDGQEAQPMALRDGWAELFAPGVGPGQRYAFVLPDGARAPDPASRFQPDGPQGPSLVVDPERYAWRDSAWRGRAWEELVIWEAHVGTASPEGTYAGLAKLLPRIAEVGFTAIEIMPLSDCPGSRNWGYDGVLPFAPYHAYGEPDELKRLVDEAHRLGLSVLLDVVYNHFGPSGNYLHAYAESFFNPKHQTPWGAAVNFDGPNNRTVRDFFTHNALYWLEEHHFDGLRFDAVHAFVDESADPFLPELATRIRGAFPGREIHLILENERNEARWLERSESRPRFYSAQWNDDSHHCWHRLLTGEQEGYYEDFDEPALRLARALSEGFVYQGEPSPHQNGKTRGERSAHLPPTAFVDFLQNHDQIGNRAFGERLAQLAAPERLDVAYASLLLSPAIPMLFMGEEWRASAPFLFFVDFSDDPELSKAVRDGRRQEFSRFAAFSDPNRIPDPTDERTFLASKLDWLEIDREPHRTARELVRTLLALRRDHVVPLLLHGLRAKSARLTDEGLLEAVWSCAAGCLRQAINFGASPESVPLAAGETPIWTSPGVELAAGIARLPSWSLLCTVRED